MSIQQLLRQEAKRKYQEYVQKVPELRRKRIETYTTLLFTFAALSVFFVFAINPTVATIINLRKQLKDSEFVKTQIDTKLQALTSLDQEYTAMTSELPTLFLAVPRTPDAPYLFGQIQALAGKHAVSLTTLQTDSVPITTSLEHSKVTSLPFTLTAEAPYDNCMQFLTDLTTLSRITTLHDISIAKTDDNEKNVQLVIKGEAYFKP